MNLPTEFNPVFLRLLMEPVERSEHRRVDQRMRRPVHGFRIRTQLASGDEVSLRLPLFSVDWVLAPARDIGFRGGQAFLLVSLNG